MHDAAYKRLFSHRPMVEDRLRAESGEWIIDCDTGADLLRRTGRMIRRI